MKVRFFYIFIISIATFLIFWFSKRYFTSSKSFSQIEIANIKLKPHENLKKADNKNEALDSSIKLCEQYFSDFKNEDDFLKQRNTTPRYLNIHKKIQNEVYRLRVFKKEGSEAEFNQYLVYKEDLNNEENLIEKNPIRPGKIYSKINKTTGDVLFRELGIENEQGVFFQFINKKLKRVEGIPDSVKSQCLF